MPASAQTLLIPFKGGLDTYSNGQLLQPGFLTLSVGTMLDRPGTAYPGPGFDVTRWAPVASTYTNHGIGALTHGTTTVDQLVTWSTDATQSGPKVYKTSQDSPSTVPPGQPLAPWRQATQRFSNDASTLVNTTIDAMAGPPQCAYANDYAFYAWLTANGSVVMVAQYQYDMSWSGPYYLDGSLNWVSSGAALTGVAQMALCSDYTYLRVALRTGTALSYASYTASATPGAAVSTGSQTNVSNIDTTTTADDQYIGFTTGLLIWVDVTDPAVNTLQGLVFDDSSSGWGSPVTLVSNLGVAYTFPITCSPIRGATTASTGFMVGVINTSTNKVKVITSTLALGSIATATFSGLRAYATARQLTLTNHNAASAASIDIAIEYYAGAQTVLGQSFAWNHVDLAGVTFASPATTVTPTTVRGWGGIAIMGKYYPWYNGVQFKPLLALRSGWWNQDGTWGTPSAAGSGSFAYPCGYLYDSNGTVYARFGEADVGTDSMWPTFSSGSYRAPTLQPIPGGFAGDTLTFAWPQYGYAEFFSARVTDAGTPIGTRAGLSTVTWFPPTATAPPAPMVQFGQSLIIPGTITAVFDGSNVFEAGFFHRGPTPILESNGGGGSLPDATPYYFQTVLVYQDATGHIHRSAPSLRVSVLTTAANDKINISCASINQTLRTSSITPIAVWVFRSTGNPSSDPNTIIPLYHIASLNVMNLVGADFITTVSDTTADADLIQYPTIYTQNMQGGASAGTFAPPPFDSLTVWSNQVWGVANVNGPELWCSWPQDNGVLEPEGIAWSAANRLALPAEIGQPKAIAGLDEKLIVLGSRADYGILAAGTMARGTSILDNPDLFSAPLLLPTPGGIKVPNGVVRIPEGLLFQGTQGFNILGRNLQYTAVGMPVKAFTRTELYLPGVFFPEQSAVLLFSTADITKNLVYFYDTKEWAQTEQPPSTGAGAAAAPVIVSTVRASTALGSQVYVLPSTGVYRNTVTPFSQYMKYRTPWIELDDRVHGDRSVAGYGMLREVQILGDVADVVPLDQTLTLYTEYDYAGNPAQETQTLNLASGYTEYQWRFGFSQGNAIRVRFTVTIDGGARTAADVCPVLLTGLMLSYDVDAGLSRLGAGSSTGT